MAKGFADLSGDIDALYQGPLSEFTAGRNALEKRVKAEQGKEARAAIKALEKPSVSAWAVNQLYWRYRGEFDRLLRTGDDLRASQQKRMAGRDVDVNAAIDARREALSKLMGRAAAILEEGAPPATTSVSASARRWKRCRSTERATPRRGPAA